MSVCVYVCTTSAKKNTHFTSEVVVLLLARSPIHVREYIRFECADVLDTCTKSYAHHHHSKYGLNIFFELVISSLCFCCCASLHNKREKKKKQDSFQKTNALVRLESSMRGWTASIEQVHYNRPTALKSSTNGNSERWKKKTAEITKATTSTFTDWLTVTDCDWLSGSLK